MDTPDAPLDHDCLVLSVRGYFTRGALGVCRARLGWLLVLGPRGKRFADALAYWHRIPSFRDDAGKARHDARVERMAGLHHVPSGHLWNVPDAQRRGEF